MYEIGFGLTLLSLGIWVGLLSIWGQFWRTDQQLPEERQAAQRARGKLAESARSDGALSLDEKVASTSTPVYPSIGVVIPARNEAELLPVTLRSLLMQDYPGTVHIVLVDDNSTDGTAEVAKNLAFDLNKTQHLMILPGQPLAPGWSGKLWAMAQGVALAETIVPPPDYLLLTDADIEHDRGNLRRLVNKAEQDDLDLVSLMVRLRCESFWEKLLIPAFVFFFQKLYPFRWVNHPTRSMAAAAGGCILVRCTTLQQIGGIQAIHQALIDDCALAHAIKANNLASVNRGRIWLGLSSLTRSLRPYPSLASIWDMVARTAFTQLHYSPWLLLGTLVGMTLVYLVPVLGLIWGIVTGEGTTAIVGLITWLLMSFAYYQMVRFYQCPLWFAFCLPAIAFLYTLMTLDSALRHWQGKGGAWKGRTYQRG
jgi:hopene-associated glycosyltransferase HpnB